jgi:prevent-host-death family protein
MTKIELKKASGPLSKYAQQARKAPVIVVQRGKPFAAVVPIRNADKETVSLSTNRRFLAIIAIPYEKGRRDFLQSAAALD